MQDIWFIACILFILCAIFEYAICLYLKRTMTRNKRKKLAKMLKEEKEEEENQASPQRDGEGDYSANPKKMFTIRNKQVYAA